MAIDLSESHQSAYEGLFRIYSETNNNDRLAELFQTAFFLYFIEAQWLKVRYGECIYLSMDQEQQLHRCPPIGEDLADPHLEPEKHFQQRWHGCFFMGVLGNQNSTAEDPRRVDWGIAVNSAIEMYVQIMKDRPRKEAQHQCADCVKVRWYCR